MLQLRDDNMLRQRSRYFVRGAFRRFYVPALLSSFWLAVAGVADSIFVGNGIGSAGLAAISLGQPIYLFYNILSYGFSIGGSIHYSSALAEGREKDANRIFMTIWKLLLGIYFVTMALGLIFQAPLMRVLGANPMNRIQFNYIRTQLIFIPVMFSQGPFYFFVNADGGPKTAALAMTVSGVTDAIFSYIFIIVMKMGVEGSVYSTVVGAVLMLLITGRHIFLKKGALRFRHESMNWSVTGISARTGFATSVQYLFQFLTTIAFNRLLIRHGGAIAVAAFDVVYNISLLCISISEGAIYATEPMLSSYRSERNLENIHITLRLEFFWSAVVTALFAALLLIFPQQLSMVFGMKGSKELLYSSLGIRIYALSALPAMVNLLFSGYYQAIYEEWLAYLITILRSLAVFFAALYLCSRHGMKYIWYVFVVDELLTMLIWMPVAMLRGGITQLKDINVCNAKTAVVDSSGLDVHVVVQQLQEFSEEHGASAKQAMYIGLVVEEICCAIIERFREQMGEIYVQVTVVMEEEGEVTLYLRDNAFEFNPFAEDTEGISLSEGKQLDLVGIRIVQKKAKEFYYRRNTGFNTLVIRM
ncbi:MAG: hypothetical protein IJH53_01125 [Oscillospiraceae bacterium]|nr:hypothetical protein [Oscillospiraceae bacterium]